MTKRERELARLLAVPIKLKDARFKKDGPSDETGF
jgi:hypothetical protein